MMCQTDTLARLLSVACIGISIAAALLGCDSGAAPNIFLDKNFTERSVELANATATLGTIAITTTRTTTMTTSTKMTTTSSSSSSSSSTTPTTTTTTTTSATQTTTSTTTTTTSSSSGSSTTTATTTLQSRALLQSVYDSKCMHQHGGHDGNVEMQDCHGDSNQLWYFDGEMLRSIQDNTCLEYDLATSNVHVSKCHGRASQLWYFAGQALKTRQSSKCLDNNWWSGNVHMYPCNGGSNQQWRLQIRAVQYLNSDWAATCELEIAHSWASVAAYNNMQESSDVEAHSKLNAAGWYIEKDFVLWNVQQDAGYLWIRDDECILAFRGSDDLEDLLNDINDIPKDYYGLPDVAAGVRYELDELLKLIHSEGGRELIGRKCGKTFGLAGHSLGGAMAQLLAAAINKMDNPLNWTRGVDAVYVIGSMSPSRSPLSNDQRPSGCFQGRNMFNAEFDPSSGVPSLDPAFHYPNSDFRHSYISRVYMQNDVWLETSCEVDDYGRFESGIFDLPLRKHSRKLYMDVIETNACQKAKSAL